MSFLRFRLKFRIWTLFPTLNRQFVVRVEVPFNNVLESFADTIKNSCVDAFVDSMTLVRSWNRQGSRSYSLSDALKKLFVTLTKLNIDLHLTFVPSSQNQADSPSRRLSLQDAKLSPSLWIAVQELYGGENGTLSISWLVPQTPNPTCRVLYCRSSLRILSRGPWE